MYCRFLMISFLTGNFPLCSAVFFVFIVRNLSVPFFMYLGRLRAYR